MALAHERMSLEEFLLLPEEEPSLEYFDGVIEQKTVPKLRHTALQTELMVCISAMARPAQLARVFPELRTTFGGRSYVPDVAIYSWARVPRDESGNLLDDATTPPDIVAEIVSPGESTNRLFRRCRWYVANGVEIALVIDPEDHSVLAIVADDTVQEWTGQDRIDLSAVIPGFDLIVDQLFTALKR